ncbi:MAG TPA: adenylate kinase, partial [Cyanobacteria bacterium UBA11162]|nr:adenylate kinase [Cyanobacteria bacterium UBA11162]
QRLLQPDATQGWLLEGYPRTAFQAEELDFLLEELSQQLNWAIYLEVPETVMMSRLVKRSHNPDD